VDCVGDEQQADPAPQHRLRRVQPHDGDHRPRYRRGNEAQIRTLLDKTAQEELGALTATKFDHSDAKFLETSCGAGVLRARRSGSYLPPNGGQPE
jgi:hypothetical protein